HPGGAGDCSLLRGFLTGSRLCRHRDQHIHTRRGDNAERMVCTSVSNSDVSTLPPGSRPASASRSCVSSLTPPSVWVCVGSYLCLQADSTLRRIRRTRFPPRYCDSIPIPLQCAERQPRFSRTRSRPDRFRADSRGDRTDPGARSPADSRSFREAASEEQPVALNRRRNLQRPVHALFRIGPEYLLLLDIPGVGRFVMRPFAAAILTLVVSCCAVGQTYTIQTFAGGGLPVNIPGMSASLDYPSSVAVNGAGNLFFVDANHVVLRWNASTAVLTLVAGNGIKGYSGDNGPATSAQLAGPGGVAVDSAGNLYIADTINARIRKVSKGVIAAVAGSGTAGFSGDGGPATGAQLYGPDGVAVNSAGNLFIADTDNDRIRVLIPSGASCSVSVAPLALSPAASGGDLTVTIRTSPSCAWAIQSLPGWITFSGAAVGTGPGNVTLSVAANSGGPRTATVSIAGVAVPVTQQP